MNSAICPTSSCGTGTVQPLRRRGCRGPQRVRDEFSHPLLSPRNTLASSPQTPGYPLRAGITMLRWWSGWSVAPFRLLTMARWSPPSNAVPAALLVTLNKNLHAGRYHYLGAGEAWRCAVG